MVGLTLALHLHELVTRRARWAAPVWLEAVLKLLCWLMPLARQEAKQAALAGGSSSWGERGFQSGGYG